MKTHSAHRDPRFAAPRGLIFSVLSTAFGVLAFAAAPALAAPISPTVTIKPVGTVTSTTAKVSGTVNPNGSPSTTLWNFQYSKDPETEGWTVSEVSGMALASEEVKGTLEGLQPNASYQVRLVATNGEGGEGASAEPNPKFKTLAAPPKIESASVSNVKSSEVTFEGTVNPNNQLTECHFQYADEAEFLATGFTKAPEVACSPELLKGFEVQSVGPKNAEGAPTPTGVSEGTAYRYQLVTKNGKGEEATLENHFQTFEAPKTEASTEVSKTAWELHGALYPNHARSEEFGTYEFVYRQSSSVCQYLLSAAEEHQLEAEHNTTELEADRAKQAENKYTTPGSASGAQGQRVEAEVSELQPGATYAFCLLQRNASGEAAAIGTPETFTAHIAAPTIAGESVTNVQETAVTLNARIDPDGAETSYHVEYGTTESYSSSTPAVSVGASAGAVGVQSELKGLSAGAEYHYRIVASNESGTEATGDATFTTAHAALAVASHSERVDEMVTPADDENVEVHRQEFYSTNDNEDGVSSNYGLFQVAADGEAVAYQTSPTPGGFGNEEAGEEGDQLLATRRAGGGWTQVLAEPEGRPFGHFAETQAYSPDFSFGVVDDDCSSCALPGVLPNEDTQLYQAPGATGSYVSPGSYVPLITTTPPYRKSNGAKANEFGAWEVLHASNNFEGLAPVFAGASADGGELLFEANDKLTENAAGGEGEDPQTHLPYAHENNLYVSSGGRLSLVNVLPDGSTEANATFGAYAFGEGEQDPPDFADVISSDGSRVFWTDLNTGDLYLRENPTQPQSPIEGGKCTVSADACTVLIAAGARYWAATPDGAKVLYTRGALYEYDVETGQSTDLSEGATVEGVLGSSQDGSYVYYAAEGAKLYVYHEGQPPRFIAQLSESDGTHAKPYYKFSPFSPLRKFEIGDWAPGLGDRTAEVTPNGHVLVFTSEESLTGYDNEAKSEVYVYQTEGGPGGAHLFCVSCAPNGEPPVPSTDVLGVGGAVLGALPLSFKGTFQPNWISEDGSEVFFESQERLVPQATDNRINVFEWQRDGTHGCGQPGGCVSLLSGGESPTASWLIGASASGDDVFMITRAQLAPQDQNEYYDVYDARVGGEQPGTPLCTGTGCQGLPAPPPTFATPASVTFAGVGNFPAPAPVVVKPPVKKAAKCAKGKTRNKKGRCIKKKKSKKAKKAKRAGNDRRARR